MSVAPVGQVMIENSSEFRQQVEAKISETDEAIKSRYCCEICHLSCGPKHIYMEYDSEDVDVRTRYCWNRVIPGLCWVGSTLSTLGLCVATCVVGGPYLVSSAPCCAASLASGGMLFMDEEDSCVHSPAAVSYIGRREALSQRKLNEWRKGYLKHIPNDGSSFAISKKAKEKLLS